MAAAQSFCFGFLVTVLAFLSATESHIASVYFENQQYVIKEEMPKDAYIAWGNFTEEINKTG